MSRSGSRLRRMKPNSIERKRVEFLVNSLKISTLLAKNNSSENPSSWQRIFGRIISTSFSITIPTISISSILIIDNFYLNPK